MSKLACAQWEHWMAWAVVRRLRKIKGSLRKGNKSHCGCSYLPSAEQLLHHRGSFYQSWCFSGGITWGKDQKLAPCSELPWGSVLLPYQLMEGATSPQHKAFKLRWLLPQSLPELLGSSKIEKVPLYSVSLLPNQAVDLPFSYAPCLYCVWHKMNKRTSSRNRHGVWKL